MGRIGALVGFNHNQAKNIFLGFQEETMNEIGGDRGGARLSRERLILVLLLGGTSCMHGVVKFTF